MSIYIFLCNFYSTFQFNNFIQNAYKYKDVGDDALLTLTVHLHHHSWKERERDSPLDYLISRNGRMTFLFVIVAPKGNSSLFGFQSAYEYAHTQTNTVLDTF